MLTIEKFNTGDNIHSTYNPVTTIVCASIGWLILTYGQNWIYHSGGWRIFIAIVLVLTLGILGFLILLGTVALKNEFTQFIYSSLNSYLLLPIFHRYFNISTYSVVWWGSLVLGSLILYKLFNSLLKKPSVLAAMQCLLGTLFGLFITSEFIYFCRALWE